MSGRGCTPPMPQVFCGLPPQDATSPDTTARATKPEHRRFTAAIFPPCPEVGQRVSTHRMRRRRGLTRGQVPGSPGCGSGAAFLGWSRGESDYEEIITSRGQDWLRRDPRTPDAGRLPDPSGDRAVDGDAPKLHADLPDP